MPKRVPTPPPGDDEPRYLTVVHPYAISGTCNMELPKDRQDFARWVACCIDNNAFFAIFHKPSSRDMVIVEIMRDYPHFDRILGEHHWSEFLQKPTKEEKDRVTQVFYCTYNTGRLVQKHGWKRIDVDEAWFKAWSPKNRHIKFPYPSTHFCDVPVEDRTNHSLCRPLPGAVKTPPPVEVIKAPQPVVGSAAWIQTKEGGPSPAPATMPSKPSPLGVWGKGAPHLQATSAKPNPTANGSVKKIVSAPQVPYAVARLPAVDGGPIVVKASNVWQNTGKKPSVVANWDDSPQVSRGGTPVSRVISPATSHQTPTTLPWLAGRKNAWEDATSHPPGLAVPGKAGSVAQCDPDRAGNVSAANWSSNGASPSSLDSDSGPDLTTATESDNPYAAHIHFSGSMEEEFHGMGIRAIEDEDDLRGLDYIAPGWDQPMGAATWETTTPAGWDDDPLDAEDQWQQTQETTVKPMLCSAHGIICKKGICAEYAKQVRQAKWAAEAEKRKAAAGANKGKKNARAKGRGAGKKNDENEDENYSAGKSTTQNNLFRGPGAPVKTTWRGTPRAIVTADTIEKRETTNATSDDGWGNSDSEVEPNAAAVASAGAGAADAASNASWGISEDSYDPWANIAQPVAKANQSGGKPQGKKPGPTKASSSWADQVEAEGNGGDDDFRTVASKRGSRRNKASTTSRGTGSVKSSSSGWGTSTTGTARSSTSGWGSAAGLDIPF